MEEISRFRFNPTQKQILEDMHIDIASHKVGDTKWWSLTI